MTQKIKQHYIYVYQDIHPCIYEEKVVSQPCSRIFKNFKQHKNDDGFEYGNKQQ